MIARRVAQELRDRLGGQPRLRHLGQRAAHPARGGPARRRHLGDRAGRRRRRAAARLPVRLRGQRRGDHALAAAVHLLPGRRLRRLAAVVPADRRATAPSTSRSSPPSRMSPPARGGFVDITARAQADRLLRLLHRRRQARASTTAGCASRPRARSRSSCPRSSTSPSAAGARVEQGQDVTYVTERCVMRLTPDGLMVTEIAPGVDLERDVLAQADDPAARRPGPAADGRALFRARADRPDAAGGLRRMASLRVESRTADRHRHARAGRRSSTRSTSPMLEALEAAADRIERDARRSASCSSPATGRRRFCAGARHRRLGRRSSRSTSAGAGSGEGHRVFDRLARLRQPLIAVLNGIALRRRARARGHRRLPRRRGACPGRPARDADRHRAGLVGHAAPGAPRRRAGGQAAGR